jgi:AraC family transcriptional activator of pobA
MAKKKLLHFDGLYGDLTSNKKESYIFLELIKTRSESFNWVIKPHVHTHLYQVFCIESGHVILESSEKKIPIITPAIAVIPPGTLHGLQYNPAVKGYILTLSDTIFEALFSNSGSLLLNFDSLKAVSFTSQKSEFKKLVNIIQQADVEIFNERTGKKLLLYALLSQFFIALLRVSETGNSNALPDTNQTILYYRKFIQSVKINDAPKTIPAYASKIGISAVHLNRICNHVCGKSALLIVQEHLIEQSKNYLSHSSNSIAEIAYHLNFEYPNYFARLFKKITGKTPTEFRKIKRNQPYNLPVKIL